MVPVYNTCDRLPGAPRFYFLAKLGEALSCLQLLSCVIALETAQVLLGERRESDSISFVLRWQLPCPILPSGLDSDVELALF